MFNLGHGITDHPVDNVAAMVETVVGWDRSRPPPRKTSPARDSRGWFALHDFRRLDQAA